MLLGAGSTARRIWRLSHGHIIVVPLLRIYWLLLPVQGAGGVGGETVLAWLAREAPDTALAAVVTAASALWWPDDVVGRAAVFCRCAPL